MQLILARKIEHLRKIEKNILNAININEPLDISLVGITQNASVRITQETPVPTKEIEKNKESESTISDIEDYINKKYNELAIFSLKKEKYIVNPKRGK